MKNLTVLCRYIKSTTQRDIKTQKSIYITYLKKTAAFCCRGNKNMFQFVDKVMKQELQLLGLQLKDASVLEKGQGHKTLNVRGLFDCYLEQADVTINQYPQG